MIHEWLLTDSDPHAYTETMDIGPNDVPDIDDKIKFSIHKGRLGGGLSDGVDIVALDNDAMSCTVLPTRGMGLRQAYVGEGEDKMFIGWDSPVQGPVHPKYVNLFEDSGLGWLDGFDELMCRCGLESNGGPVHKDGNLTYPLHGRIANTPAKKVTAFFDADKKEVGVTGVVDETRLFHNKLQLTSTVSMPLKKTRIIITDEVKNISAEPGEMQLLYHTNFGEKLLENGSMLVAPVKTVVPQTRRSAEGVKKWNEYGPPEPGYTEMVNFLELLSDSRDNTEVLLKNSHSTAGVSLIFNTCQLPWFTQWKNLQCVEDGYVTGLEPGVNLPNSRDFESEKGRVVELDPGEVQKFVLEIVIHTKPDEVEKAEKRIAVLQRNVKPKIYTRWQEDWSPEWPRAKRK